MEESLVQKLKKEFQCKEVDIRTYSPLSLAFIGDCIYDLIIRTVVVERGNCGVNSLHKTKSGLVKAETQAAMGDALQEDLTEEERIIYRRGRNAKSYTTAKNASIGDYHKATALEALFGYLYLTDDVDRIIELTKLGLKKVNLEV